MPAERMAAIRRVASQVAAYDEHAALTEVERTAIILAREILTALDEIDRLRKIADTPAGRILLGESA